MAESRGPPGLPPVVKALGAVSLLNDFASEMVYPLLPALVRGVGGGALALGALDGIADAVSSGVKYLAGVLGDRPRWRRPLVVGGYLLATITRPLMGLAGAAWQVVGLRALDRVGKGARTPPRDALIADAVRPDVRGRAFGFHRAMDHAGAMVGPLVAAGLMAAFAFSPSRVILWSVLPGVLAVAVAAWALGRRYESGHAPPVEPSRGRVAETHAAPRRPLFALVLGFALLRMPETLLLLRVQDLGVPLALVPILWAVLHLVRSGASYPGGWLTDHLGAPRTMLLGWLCYALVCLGLATVAHPILAGGAFLAFGLVAALTEAPERALVAAWSDGARGRGFGVYHAGVGFAALPGGLALGALYDWRGGPVALRASAMAAVAVALAGTWVVRGAPRVTA